MKVLITSGATREPIDSVRFLTNFSTGATGAVLADHFRRRGHRVVYLHGRGAQKPEGPVECIAFEDFKDLDRRLRELLRGRRFDLVLHLAAVSDYSVAAVLIDGRRQRPARLRKIDSGAEVRVELKRNFKILGRLAGYAANRPLIVGFKLTDTKDQAAIRRAVGRLGCGLVVHNDLRDMADGRPRRFRIFGSGRWIAACSSRAELARRLCAVAEHRRGHASCIGRGQ
ncbi:MAG: DNA/pantothenate metabolism flavoprotein [Elusimicrobia bacterium]|nr:DNA/pantothenate metabolism flavoprotein [Elusimicrobiota bacterium]